LYNASIGHEQGSKAVDRVSKAQLPFLPQCSQIKQSATVKVITNFRRYCSPQVCIFDDGPINSLLIAQSPHKLAPLDSNASGSTWEFYSGASVKFNVDLVVTANLAHRIFVAGLLALLSINTTSACHAAQFLRGSCVSTQQQRPA
jgi:hypothetical protein